LRARRRLRWALVPVLLAVALIGRDGSAAAVGMGGATWTPRVAVATLALAGFRSPRDSVYVFVRLTWDKAGVRALRRYEQDGLRSTQGYACERYPRMARTDV